MYRCQPGPLLRFDPTHPTAGCPEIEPHFTTLPFAIAQTDLIALLPRRLLNLFSAATAFHGLKVLSMGLSREQILDAVAPFAIDQTAHPVRFSPYSE